MLNKQEKERLTAAERAHWKDERMVKYCVGKAQLLFDLRGKIVVIEKASVETNFCFGYGMWDGTMEEAESRADHATKSTMYFLRQNHRRANYARHISRINDARVVVYAMPEYRDQDILYGICYMNHWDYECGKLPENAFILTDEEKQAYKKKLAEAALLHHKKLAAYLKRYGLSKIHTWTYWADE